MNQGKNTHDQRVPTAALFPFTLITFIISWGILGFYIFLSDAAGRWFGEITGRHPAFEIAGWGTMFSRHGAMTEVMACTRRTRVAP